MAYLSLVGKHVRIVEHIQISNRQTCMDREHVRIVRIVEKTISFSQTCMDTTSRTRHEYMIQDYYSKCHVERERERAYACQPLPVCPPDFRINAFDVITGIRRYPHSESQPSTCNKNRDFMALRNTIIALDPPFSTFAHLEMQVVRLRFFSDTRNNTAYGLRLFPYSRNNTDYDPRLFPHMNTLA